MQEKMQENPTLDLTVSLASSVRTDANLIGDKKLLGSWALMDRELKLLPLRSKSTVMEYGLVAAGLLLAIAISLHGLAGKIAIMLAWFASGAG